jgi:septal ring-binding cell division protein DamX
MLRSAEGSYSRPHRIQGTHHGLTLAFLDEEELAPPPGGTRPPSRRGPDRQRQILVRRAVGIGVVVVVLILIVLGIKGCLDARKTRSFENYVSDLKAITAQTNQLSGDFFGKLSDPGNASPLDFEAGIATDRGTAQNLASRVDAIDTPGELSDAQSKLELSYNLRAQALSGISAQISTALGNPGPERTKALASITDNMQSFLASDVLYKQAQSEIDTVLSDQGIDEKAPASVFMTDPTRWLDPLQVASALSAISAKKTSGSHGVAIVQTMVKPGSVVLSSDTPTTVSGGSGAPSIDVEVSNQGSATEKGIGVSYSLTGGPQTIDGTTTIPSITAGGVQTASLPVQPSPERNVELTLEITVLPVPGETITTNNRFTYQLTFR